eukprot:CAMPEP_0194293146 /NCGR_PEP_ID=MMETSP0169-20130528/47267_1 /TAXON_ID=218684 /ORGANISM="Corethron pennatum, Strain L29A3" /LENGTH=217 /DNA_ID=CAMNT_0039041561 /DNA_START=98 /DNA_END=751 /DNA_ORIENTATION=-
MSQSADARSARPSSWSMNLNRRPAPPASRRIPPSKKGNKQSSSIVPPRASPSDTDVPLPPGMALCDYVDPKASLSDFGGSDGANATGSVQLMNKKKAMAMNMAWSPSKGIPMQFFMMWMSGTVLNIFSISITTMACMNPVKAILGSNSAFQKFEDEDGKVSLTSAKLIFVVMNLIMLMGGLYKMGTLRLLPTTSADWSGYVVWKDVVEKSYVPAALS